MRNPDATDARPRPYGVYVHVPFCTHRCDYCDFATWTDREHLIDDYVDACVTDLGRRYAGGALPLATTVFFGGGTPSLLDASQLGRILDAIPRGPGAEVTIECNPDAVDAEKLAGYRAAGANRLSFGVQSMAAHVLASLGRTHRPENVERAVRAARDAGFERINLDVIYGADGESVADWELTLRAVLELAPEHVSAYGLTVEPPTPLAARVRAGEVRPPDDDDQAEKYALADAVLEAAGYRWYEISNWAKPGEECRHNQIYWRGGDYLAIGCAAHGHTGGRRWWNVRTPERYLAAIAAGEDPGAGEEILDPGVRAEETFSLELRTGDGTHLPLEGPDPDPELLALVSDLVAAGLLVREGVRVVLTPTGRLMANDLTARLLNAGAARPFIPAGTR
ncbi:MAG: putative oxygen-independent coproporphyrinogen oxidase [Actinomycetia bacterium]|nr:putative oxygen-independent coproporphyrinogen oxidase [Actinomycetes bacterium]